MYIVPKTGRHPASEHKRTGKDTPMKVMAINGSPRKNWNTDTLLKNVLDEAET